MVRLGHVGAPPASALGAQRPHLAVTDVEPSRPAFADELATTGVPVEEPPTVSADVPVPTAPGGR